MPLRRRLALLLACALSSFASLAIIVATAAHADPYLPPDGKVFAGVTGGKDVAAYEQATHKHPPVFQFFSSFGAPLEYMFQAAEREHARLMIHVSTLTNGRETVTPGAIANGAEDGYLIGLNERIAQGDSPVYVRLMSEMNGHWNPYAAFDANGRGRGAARTTAAFRRAWKRSALIVRGGDVAAIDRRLKQLGLPPVRTGEESLARPKVAFLWVPQVAGAPDTRANAPRAYWPGREYVDWVGTDFYSKFPNFTGLERFYREFAREGKPFMFGEWAMWGRDDAAFVQRFFAWAGSHGRVRMLMYNQGNKTDGPFRLHRYPRAAKVLRAKLGALRFAPFAPEYARP
jgi:hypothetical protein